LHFTGVARQHEVYRKELENHGHSIVGRDLPMARLLAVAETERAAAEIAQRGAQWLVASYVNPSKGAVAVAQAAARPDAPVDLIAHYLDGVIIYGTPERVFDDIQRLRQDMFLEYLLCAPLSHASFMLFTEKVLPRLL
jgi:alkanesulfonate monooxygenase SsuD/methylene tetrahydromethanopterin reductase-like flavin-dependent oxidoreductase (luciferase family)